MRIKEILCGVIIGSLLTSGIFVVAEEALSVTPNPFKITVNGEAKNIEGYNINGATYFKLRDIGDEVGFSVDFKEDTIMITDDEKLTTPSATSGRRVSADIYTENDITYYTWKYCASIGILKNSYIDLLYEGGDITVPNSYNVVLRKNEGNGRKDTILFENIEYRVVGTSIFISENYINEVLLPIDKSLSE